LHAVVDSGAGESRRERRIVRSLRLVSRELGILGVADVVQFERDDEKGAVVSHWPGKWIPCPIEYKWGTAKNEEPYRRQLCAQAMCLEELFGVAVPEGALYLATTKHRTHVSLDGRLRTATRETCRAVRDLLASGKTPPPEFGPHCKNCSLVEECRPKACGRSARAWLERELQEASE
jgi:CRISPR-associated exonuclease Cas4